MQFSKIRLVALKLSVLALAAILLGLPGAGIAAVRQLAPLPQAKEPVLITPAGQGPGGAIASVLCRRNKIECKEFPMAKVEHIKGVKTLIVVMGSSQKGLGAAGISIDQELTRVKGLIEEAKKQGVFVLGIHTEGEARRGGHCERVIDEIAHRVDYLIVRSDGNKDGRFDRIAQEKKVPMSIVDETAEVGELLKGIFGKL